MSLPRTLLGLLDPQPAHGYDLKRAYDQQFGGDKPLAYGQVYAALARMLQNGLVEVAGVEPGEGPDRKRYAITDAGVTELELARDPRAARAVPAEHALHKVVLAVLTGSDPHDLLDTQRAAHLDEMRVLTRRKQDGDLADQLDLRPRPVPPRGGPALAGAHRRPDRGPRLGGGSMTRPARGRRACAKTFGPTPALDGAAIQVQAGEVVAIVGAVRLRQVDAAALPGRHPAARRRPGPVPRLGPHAMSDAERSRSAAPSSASCSSSASSSPS